MDIQNLIQTVLIYALPVVFAITVHEAAHGYVARYFGDNTAYVMGRVTLNPIKHIDPIGTILMPLLLYFATSGAFLFGYAKPVPVNFNRLRHPKRDMVWVALAGPASNFFQAILWALFLVGLVGAGIDETFFIKMAQGGVLARDRARSAAGALLPAVGHPRDSRAHLAADLRGRQGPAQPVSYTHLTLPTTERV